MDLNWISAAVGRALRWVFPWHSNGRKPNLAPAAPDYPARHRTRKIGA